MLGGPNITWNPRILTSYDGALKLVISSLPGCFSLCVLWYDWHIDSCVNSLRGEWWESGFSLENGGRGGRVAEVAVKASPPLNLRLYSNLWKSRVDPVLERSGVDTRKRGI